MKKFGKIKDIRLVDVQVFLNDEIIYEGRTEDAPKNIGEFNYSKVEMSNDMKLYVYDE